MKIFSNGQFDVTGKTYVFDPSVVRFLPIEKFLRNGINKNKIYDNILKILNNSPSNIFLRYDSRETDDKELREFRIFLHDELRERLTIDGEEIEHKGTIPKHNDCNNGAHTTDQYEYCVRDALKKASRLYKLQNRITLS